MTHELKCWPVFFAPLADGRKRAELRRNDRTPPFAVGDELKLREWDPATQEYTKRYALARIIHIDTGGPIPDGYVLLSISPPSHAHPATAH